MRTYGCHNLLKLTRLHGPGRWPLDKNYRAMLGGYDKLPPSTGLLDKGLVQPIRRICFAFCKYRPEIGYTQGKRLLV